jgi:lysophospholipase L1-like esterase
LKKSVIVCWGDSLTAGMGASFGQDYPAQLSALLSRPTLNEGIPGDTSTQIRMRMMQRPPGIDEGITVIWAGRNNYRQNETVVTDIAAMVQSLPQGAHYLVLGIINGDFIGEEKGGAEYAHIIALNAALQRIYAERFIAVRENLTKQGNQDGRDVIPSNLRADPLHLGDPGYRVVAQLLEAKINSLGW